MRHENVPHKNKKRWNDIMSLAGKTIIVDAGHGGKYPGVTNSERVEKTVALMFAKVLQSKLQSKGATVYMTRTTDKDFGGTNADDDVNKRVAYINKNLPQVHALISIHCNTPTGLVGPIYQDGNAAAKSFAENVSFNYGGQGARKGNLAIIRDTTRTRAAILLEIAQIDDDWLDNSTLVSNAVNDLIAGIDAYIPG